MNVVICDDNSLYQQSIREKINYWITSTGREKSVQIRIFSSSEDLLEAWENGLRIDLLFLDIEIPGEMNGLELAKQVFRNNKTVQIVFITNFSCYALEGYYVNALRYLMKPVLQRDIDECMDIAWNRWHNSLNGYIRATTKSAIAVISINELMYAEASGRNLLLKLSTSNEVLVTQERLHTFFDKLPRKLFAQCHRSYLVNVMYVRQMRLDTLTISDGTEIPVGRKYASSMRSLFNDYYQGERNVERYT